MFSGCHSWACVCVCVCVCVHVCGVYLCLHSVCGVCLCVSMCLYFTYVCVFLCTVCVWYACACMHIHKLQGLSQYWFVEFYRGNMKKFKFQMLWLFWMHHGNTTCTWWLQPWLHTRPARRGWGLVGIHSMHAIFIFDSTWMKMCTFVSMYSLEDLTSPHMYFMSSQLCPPLKNFQKSALMNSASIWHWGK